MNAWVVLIVVGVALLILGLCLIGMGGIYV